MPIRVVCISHTLGAGGPEIGRLVSERLGFRYLDDEIVAWAAERGGLDEELVADVEQRRSLARRLLEELVWTAPMVAPARTRARRVCSSGSEGRNAFRSVVEARGKRSLVKIVPAEIITPSSMVTPVQM